MTKSSLNAGYFDGIFESSDDPWNLASSDYEAEKFDHTRAALADRRYANAFEIGCAHGVLTERLVTLCDRLLAVDISVRALALAHDRIGDRPDLVLEEMAFPREAPDGGSFDLVVLSEVAYYWGEADLERASAWLIDRIASQGRLILVHYTCETDYPQSGDAAVETLWNGLRNDFTIQRSDRLPKYRLDLWQKL